MEEKMNSKIQLLLALLLTITAYAYHRETRVKIAILDSGADQNIIDSRYLCKSGHKSFFDTTALEDVQRNKHGTNVYGLVAEEIDFKTHCILIIKVFEGRGSSTSRIVEGIRHAISENVDFINLSISSTEVYSDDEKEVFVQALEAGINVSLAAGNNGKNLDPSCNLYPVCYRQTLDYENFHVVGSYTQSHYRYSNYGSVVTHLEDGTDRGFNSLSGTSQATAVHTGKWAAKWATK